MLKKISVYFMALAMVLLLTGFDLMAQTRINFKRGHTSATVRGKFAKNESRTYVVRAKEGQTIAVSVSSKNGEVLLGEENTSTSYSFTADSGDNYIPVANYGSATSFTLTVSIE